MQHQKKISKSTHQVEEDSEELVPETEYDILTLQDQSTKPYTVEVELNGIPVVMELDTGAWCCSLHNHPSFFAAFNQQTLHLYWAVH